MPETILSIQIADQAKIEAQICTAIKRAMSKSGITYKALAAALGRPLGTVHNWLNGRAPIPAGLLAILARTELAEFKVPLKMIAESCGHEFKPTPGYLRNYHPQTKPIEDFQLDCFRGIAAFNSEVDEGKKDGRFTSAEAEEIRAAGERAILEIMETVAKVTGGRR